MDNEKLLEYRLSICKQCPLWSENDGNPTCNQRKWISRTGDWSYMPKRGYTRGCGCYLKQKAFQVKNHCIIGKW